MIQRTLLSMLLALALLGQSALASSIRTIDVDSLKSSDHTKTWTPPAATDTLVGRASTDSLSNKTISGASNTLSNLPVDAQFVQETPSGTVNGSNVSFTLANTPPNGASVQILLDGINQSGNFTVAGATVTMGTAPSTGQTIKAIYSKF